MSSVLEDHGAKRMAVTRAGTMQPLYNQPKIAGVMDTLSRGDYSCAVGLALIWSSRDAPQRAAKLLVGKGDVPDPRPSTRS
jgi:hypothetical protein